ncbi:MAG: restriction endonuclease, partial [Promethearchaeota archaeon]
GKIAKPDILLTLFGSETMENIKKAEIQVKTYYPTNKVNKNEIESSLKLLSEHKIHYLYFLTLSPLSDDAIKALQEYNTQVGRISKLTPEETCYLLLLTRYFSNLFFKKKILTPNLYLQIFEKFGLKLNKLLERIKNIIPVEISTRKKKSEEKKPIKPPPPKPSKEKISNPSKIEPLIIKLLEEEKVIRSQQIIIDKILEYATSQNVIKNAMSNLKEKKIIEYSRKKPQGWSLII